jgi:hypothetical protein
MYDCIQTSGSDCLPLKFFSAYFEKNVAIYREYLVLISCITVIHVCTDFFILLI